MARPGTFFVPGLFLLVAIVFQSPSKWAVPRTEFVQESLILESCCLTEHFA